MAGRPPAIMSLVRALSKMSAAEIRMAIASVSQESQDGRLSKLERQRDKHLAAARKLEQRIVELSGGAPRRRRKPGRRKGYTVSAATRRKMSASAKRRHAQANPSKAPAFIAKRTRRAFSAETRAKMAAAQKARWAKVKKPR